MTAGNSTPLSDGAATVLLSTEAWAREHNLPVLAHVIDAETAAVDYVHGGEGLLIAPAYAVPRLLDRNRLSLQDFDLYEMHEAFASTVLATLKAWEDPAFSRARPVLTGSAAGARIDLRWIPLAVTSHSPLAGEGPGEGSGPWSAIIFDATGITNVADLSELHAFTAPAFRNLRPCGRLLVLGTPPEDLSDAAAAAAQRALDGFIRSAGKEARSGSTANLIYVGEGAESGLEATLRFFLSGRSAYVSGQVVLVRPAKPPPTADWTISLKDRVPVVTGA